jgi:hypothetical protein
MAYLVGIVLALAVSLFGTFFRFDRERSFYPVMTIVIASTYQLFAAMAGTTELFSLETAMFVVFVSAAVLGFRTNLWIVVGALAGHGTFDLVHPHLIANPGVPVWWPAFCMTYDISAALYLAWLLKRSILSPRQADHLDPQKGRSSDQPHFGNPIRPFVQAELDAAAGKLGGDFSASFQKLERAHVLSQVSTREHVRVHWHMLVWAARRRDLREILGQIFRIVGAATKTAIGLIPTGNTGGANVNPFKRIPIPEDLADIPASASKQSEPPRVYRRVICSVIKRPYQVCSSLHRTPPLLRRVGRIRWGQEACGCYTSRSL